MVIACAIACDPKVIIADEPTTALDVTVQAEILDLLRDLRDRLGSAIPLITHNMGVVADLADRMVVMNAGKVVETATAASYSLRLRRTTRARCWRRCPTSAGAPPSTRRPMNRPKLSSKSTTSACSSPAALKRSPRSPSPSNGVKPLAWWESPVLVSRPSGAAWPRCRNRPLGMVKILGRNIAGLSQR